MSGWSGRELLPITWGDVFIMFLLGEWVTFCLPGGIGSEAGPGVAPGPPFMWDGATLHTMIETCARRAPAGGGA